MRNQHATPHRTTWKRTTLAIAAVIAAVAAYVMPAAVYAEVVVEQRYLTAQQARLTHGEDLYNELCAVCHGLAGTGDGPAVSALSQQPLDLTVLSETNDNVFPRESLEDSIYGKNRIAAHGTLDMPVWGRAFEFTRPDATRHERRQFARHRINNIVDYIETLQVD